MLSIEENKKSIYPKIETLYERDTNFKVNIDLIKKPEFTIIDKWEVTEKIDGTNIRIVWKDKQLSFLGRTERAELPKDLLCWLEENITPESMFKVFKNAPVVLYGEGYGNKIQSGKAYSEIAKFILFDIKIDKWWLKRFSIEEIATSLNIDVVPLLGKFTTLEIMDMVKKGFPSKIGNVPICEGIIAKTDPILMDRKGNRVMFKLKHKDF